MRVSTPAAPVRRGLGPWLVFAAVIGLTAAVTANAAQATDPTCLTKAEARKKFPKAHLYWHTQHRCWDATPTWRASRANYKRRLTVEHAMEAPPTRYRVMNAPTDVSAKTAFTPWDERVEGAFAEAREHRYRREDD